MEKKPNNRVKQLNVPQKEVKKHVYLRRSSGNGSRSNSPNRYSPQPPVNRAGVLPASKGSPNRETNPAVIAPKKVSAPIKLLPIKHANQDINGRIYIIRHAQSEYNAACEGEEGYGDGDPD